MAKHRRPVRVPITIGIEGSLYTAKVHIGSRREEANVMLDTGSSMFAVVARSYDPLQDRGAKHTSLAQRGDYGDGSGWYGPVVRTDVRVLGKGGDLILPRTNIAIAQRAWGNMFGQSQGILGLAYRALDKAIDLSAPTLPARFRVPDLRRGGKVFIAPYFTQVEDSGREPGRFAFYTKRFMSRVGKEPAADSANKGFLIFGGGEGETDLYQGPFQSVAVQSDDYYSVNLRQVIVGRKRPIKVPPPRQTSESVTNACIDSGTNNIDLPNPLHGELLSCFTPAQARALHAGRLPVAEFRPQTWPDVTFVLEGLHGANVHLTLPPRVYWQPDGEELGIANCGIVFTTGDASILGLPLMNAYYTVFDPSANRGMGVVKFAPAR